MRVRLSRFLFLLMLPPCMLGMPGLTSLARAQTESIVAVVNGDVISRADVENREKLFALSTGLPISQDVLNRLGPQVTKQLIDEKLRLQEEQRRHIIVSDHDIAEAIQGIEQRNNLPPGALRQKLQGQGVAMRTLIDQIRVQLGWTRLLRELLGPSAELTKADIQERLNQLKAATGQTEYRVSEIFIPVDEPSRSADAQKFAETVIGQLRAGAPFAVVAAQFSQSQTALQGGDLGWVETNQVDPAVAQVLTQMPVGAVSNPIPVAGGYSIVTLLGKRTIGRDMATVVRLREAFLPFTDKLDPQHPTEQQRAQLVKAQQIERTVKSCDAMEAANAEAGNKRPSDPGELRLENVANPALRSLLSSLPVGKTSRPLVASDGIAVIIVCSRDQQNVGMPTEQEVAQQLLAERVELESRQLMGQLRRRAVIERRSNS